MAFLHRRNFFTFILLLITTLMISACQTIPPGLTPQQIAVLKKEGFVQNEDDWELSLSGKFLFDVDKDVLGKESTLALQRLAQALLDVGIARVRVDGHTDDTGESAYNMLLSERRAQTVADKLVSSGMRRDMVQIRGLGDTQPVKPGKTREDRRENRRVVVVVSSSAPN
ncbi:MAG: OmpA family protein [Burkholderiaceae bacterium]